MTKPFIGTMSEAITQAQEGDQSAMLYCLDVIKTPLSNLVSRYTSFSAKQGTLVDKQDIYNESIVYILENLHRFKPNTDHPDAKVKNSFIKYYLLEVRHVVRGACQSASQPVNLPEWATKYAAKINRAVRAIADEQEGNFAYSRLDPEEVAARSGVPLSRVKLYLAKGLGRGAAMMYKDWQELVFMNDEVALVDSAGAGEATEPAGASVSALEHALMSEETKEIVVHAWRLMDDLQKQVLSLRYGFGSEALGRKAVASTLGISEHRVRETERDGLEIIREVIEKPPRERTGTA